MEPSRAAEAEENDKSNVKTAMRSARSRIRSNDISCFVPEKPLSVDLAHDNGANVGRVKLAQIVGLDGETGATST